MRPTNINVYIDIDEKTINELQVVNSVNHIAKSLTACLKKMPNSFPYKRHYLNKEEMIEKFNNLKEYVPNVVHLLNPYKIVTMPYIDPVYNDKYTMIENKLNDYDDFLIISEYFSEEIRIKSNKYNLPSPEKYWNDNTQVIVEKCINQYKSLNAYTLRETLYREIPECNTFRVTLAKTLIDMFDGRHILDMSAGWGDRLIGFLASGADSYTGVDPNLLLKPVHDEIIATLPHNKTDIKLIYEPFENVQLSEDDFFDLCVTCPPYFVTEIYHSQDDKLQSTSGRNVYQWINQFMIPSLNKIFDHLHHGGHLLLVMNDPLAKYKIPRYMDKIIRHGKIRSNVKFMGVMSFGELHNDQPKNPQPIWIFKKV